MKKDWRMSILLTSLLMILFPAFTVAQVGQVTLLTEGFESANVPGLPTGWASVTVQDGDYAIAQWQTNSGTHYPSGTAAHSGSNVAYFNSFFTGPGGSARLYTTGGLDTSSVGCLQLNFWMYHDTGYPSWNDQIQLQVSTNAGANWTNVGAAFSRYDGTTGWAQHTVNLSAYAGQSDLRIGFLGISGYGYDCHIDDIEIVGSAIPITYVKADAPGANNGSSWTNAYTDLQSALAAPSWCEQIWVSKGTYKPGASGNRSATFEMKDGVKIYGGFAGTETNLSQRNWRTNVTILSGDLDGSGDLEWNNNDAYHVVSASRHVSNTARLDGFTISGGNANGESPDDCGGGLNVYYSVPEGSFGNPELENLIFIHNFASDRGGGAFFDLADTITTLTLTNVTFKWFNESGYYGAALYAYKGTFNFANCLFNGNHSDSYNGGIIYDEYGTMTFDNTTFSFNTKPVVSTYGVSGYPASVTLINSILWGNAAVDPDNDMGLLYESGGSTSFSVSYSDVQDSGGSGAWTLAPVIDGGHNIAADPLFLGNYNPHVFPGSPVIDAGNNSAVPAGVSTDLDGFGRFFNDTAKTDTGSGTAPIVDMGAYEYHGYEHYMTGDNFSVNPDIEWFAQSFTATSAHTVGAVNLKLYRDQGYEGTITVSIRAASFRHPTGADLCSGSIDSGILTDSTAGEWYVIPMTGNCILNAGSDYTVVVRATASGSGSVYWEIDSAPYEYTSSYSYEGSTWYDLQFGIFMFQILGDAVGGITHTVTYDGNYSDGGSVPSDSNVYNEGDSVTVLGNTGGLTKIGYTFAGWNTQTDGNGTNYSGGNTFSMGSSDVTLYAKWTAETYTVGYNANGATSGSSPSDQTKTYGVDLTLATNIGGLAKTGYTFSAWNTASNGSGTDYAAGGTYSANSAVTLYAKWTANSYTVTFDGNGGGTPSPTSKSVTYASTYGPLATVSRTGYIFNGWYTAGSGGTQVTSGSTVTTVFDHTLYAQWTANSYTVTFDGNGGGTPSPTSKSVTYASTYGPLATVSRTGYTFNGWYTAGSGGTQVTSGSTVTTVSDHTLYAQWTQNSQAPSIITHPSDQEVAAGETANFTADVSGTPTPTVQWQVLPVGGRWTNIRGATLNSYSFTAQAADNGKQYRAVFTNIAGTAATSPAILTITGADVAITDNGSSYNSSTNSIIWRLYLVNNGPSIAQGIVVTDSLASGTKLSSVNITGGNNSSYKVRGRTVTISIPSLDPGTSASVTINIQASVGRLVGTISNSVTVKTATPDPNMSNNTITSSVTVGP